MMKCMSADLLLKPSQGVNSRKDKVLITGKSFENRNFMQDMIKRKKRQSGSDKEQIKCILKNIGITISAAQTIV